MLELENLLCQLSHSVSDPEETSRFVDGLHDSLKRRIVDKRLENPALTHQQVVALAVTLESSTRLAKESKPRDSAARDPAIAALEATLAAFQGKFKQKRCWYCKKTGHTAETCRAIQKKRDAGTWKEIPPKK